MNRDDMTDDDFAEIMKRTAEKRIDINNRLMSFLEIVHLEIGLMDNDNERDAVFGWVSGKILEIGGRMLAAGVVKPLPLTDIQYIVTASSHGYKMGIDDRGKQGTGRPH